MKSNSCKVCGTLGGGGTTDCVNKLRHNSLLKAKRHLKSMQKDSNLFKFADSSRTGHSILKKVLSKKLNSIREEKNKGPKSFYFKRKINA